MYGSKSLTMTQHKIMALKRQISALEHSSRSSATPGSDTAQSPFEELESGMVHEVMGAQYEDRPAVLGVSLAWAAHLLARRTGPLLWLQYRDGDPLPLYGPGLTAFGVDPGRLLFMTLAREQDLLWAMEEALTCSYLAGIVGILWAEKIYDFTTSRRLLMRAQSSGVTTWVVRSHKANGSTAAQTRWCISSAPSTPTPNRSHFMPGLGKARWRMDLVRHRKGTPKRWDVIWNHETLHVDLAAPLADRAPLSPMAQSRILQHAHE